MQLVPGIPTSMWLTPLMSICSPEVGSGPEQSVAVQNDRFGTSTSLSSVRV